MALTFPVTFLSVIVPLDLVSASAKVHGTPSAALILALVNEEPLTERMIRTLPHLVPFRPCEKLGSCTDNRPEHPVKGIRVIGPLPVKAVLEASHLQSPHRVSKSPVQAMDVVVPGRLALRQRREDAKQHFPNLNGPVEDRESLRGATGRQPLQPPRLFHGKNSCMTTPINEVPVAREVFRLRGFQPGAEGIGEVEAQMAAHKLDVSSFSFLGKHSLPEVLPQNNF